MPPLLFEEGAGVNVDAVVTCGADAEATNDKDVNVEVLARESTVGGEALDALAISAPLLACPVTESGAAVAKGVDLELL